MNLPVNGKKMVKNRIPKISQFHRENGTVLNQNDRKGLQGPSM